MVGGRVLLWAGLVGLALAGSACDSEDPFESAQKALAGADAALRKEKTATVQFDVNLSNQYGSDSVHWAGTSRTRFGSPDTTETEFTRASVEAPNAQLGAGQPLSETREVDLREITVGEVRYQRSSKLRTPEGKPWVKLTGQNYALYGTSVANPDLGVIDPRLYLKMLEGISQSAAVAAQTDRKDDLDGVPAQLYQMDCELGGTDCPNSGLPTVFINSFPGTSVLSINLWIDDEGRPRKLKLSADLDTGRSIEPSTNTIFYKLTSTMTFTGFGKPVEVAEPPAAETTSDYRLVP